MLPEALILFELLGRDSVLVSKSQIKSSKQTISKIKLKSRILHPKYS